MASQFAETLILGGYEMDMCCLPLGGSLAPRFKGWRGCDRAYQRTWEIQEGRLYLIKLVGTLKDGSKATLATLFPETPERVFANWYTGPLIEPDVYRTKYITRGGCIYDCDLYVSVYAGLVSEAYLSRAGGPKDTEEVEWRYGTTRSGQRTWKSSTGAASAI